MSTRTSRPEHAGPSAAPAPGELELLRSFLSLHDREPGSDRSLAPSPERVGRWLRDHGLLPHAAGASEDELAWALEIHDALRSLVLENMGRLRDPRAIARLDAAARTADLRVSFGADPEPVRTSTGGVPGAVGRLLAIAFLAELRDDWRRLRGCSSPTCTAIFYDRSKNHSGKWCSMRTCGNRDKVRRFRERRAREVPSP